MLIWITSRLKLEEYFYHFITYYFYVKLDKFGYTMARFSGRDVLTSAINRGFIFLAVLMFIVYGDSTFRELEFSVEPEDLVAVRGEPALLNCSSRSDGGTSPTMQWIRDGVVLNFNGDSRRSVLQNGSLYFSSIEHTKTHKPDEGEYQCLASLKQIGTIVSRKAELTVAYLNRNFIAEPVDVTVHLGDSAVFECEIEGVPIPRVTWYKDGQEMDTDSDHTYVHMNGMLEFKKVMFADLARYKCKAENKDRSRTSEEVHLTQNTDITTYKDVAPHFIITPRNRVALEGSIVTLHCAANGRNRDERPPQISWIKDGDSLDIASNGRFTISGTGSLTIEALQEKDSGTYTCRADNGEDSEDASADLVVQVPPRFRKRPKNVSARVNSDVEFECDVYGYPTPDIKWIKNGETVIPSAYFQIIDNRNLKILGLMSTDKGVYQCFAENSVGSIQASAQLAILETDSPPEGASSRALPSEPVSFVATVVSKRFVTLSWKVPTNVGTSDVTSYSVHWKEQNSDRERMMNTSALEAYVQHLKPGTLYTFRVHAYNRAGPSQKANTVTVTTQEEVNVPEMPTNLVAVPLSTTSIRVTWDPPILGYEGITHYKLFYYQTDLVDDEQEVTSETRSYDLTELRIHKTYSVRVVAYNDNGSGSSTEEVMATTFSAAPSEAPQNVTVEVVSSTSLMVRWEPPPEDRQNGVITGYKLRYRKKGSRKTDSTTTNANVMFYTLKDLNPDNEYQIRIQALNVNGSSPTSPWYSGTTYLHDLDESTVPGKPSSLRARATSDAIHVSWTPPREQDIMIRGYILGYGVGVPDVFKQVLGAEERFKSIKNLKPSSEYVITLRAFNEVGEGQQAYETVFTREIKAAEPLTPMLPPVGLQAIVLSSTTILLTWSDNSLGRNQRVNDNRYYVVRYNPRSSKKEKKLNSTDLNIHIDDLKPSTDYEFSVKVVKGRRQSTWSLSVFNRTKEDAPATAPRDLTPVAVPKHPHWVTLNWQPPRQPNGQITGYLVFYTTDNTQRDSDWVIDGIIGGDKLSTTITDLTPDTTYFFKVQARNSKGSGPNSPTVIFRTPKADGTGGGRIELPDDYGKRRPDYTYRDDLTGYTGSSDKSSDGGISPLVLYISIACVGGVTVIAIIVVTVIVCCRKKGGDNKRKGGYQPANKGMKPGHTDLKPPDLWIHSVTDTMEMKGMGGDKGDPNESTPMRRDSQDKGSDLDGSDRGHYDPYHEEDRYHRTPSRSKPPIMIPVEQPPPPREPIATAVPNGHMSGSEVSSNPTPIRPIYPRTQYQAQYSSTPRVNAGDTQQGFVKPQQPPVGVTSPNIKSPKPPINPAANPPFKPRQPPMPVGLPKAPDVTIRGNGGDDEVPKSYSTEELSAEMANLDVLMKDLNAITQQEFEC